MHFAGRAAGCAARPAGFSWRLFRLCTAAATVWRTDGGLFCACSPPVFLEPGKAVAGHCPRGDVGWWSGWVCMSAWTSWRPPCGRLRLNGHVFGQRVDLGDEGHVAACAEGSGHRHAGWLSPGRQRQGVGEGELGLKQVKGLAFGTVVEAVVADLAEPGREDVLEEPADELLGIEAGGSWLAGGAVAETEDDFPVVVAQDGGVGEGDAEDVACEIGQRLVAGADRLGVDHPGLAPDGIRHGGKEVGVCDAQEVAEAGGKQDRKGADGNEELRACLATGAVGSEASTGGQDMNVRMVDQLSRPGVKDGGERGQAAEVAGIAAEVEQGRDGGLEEERQDLAGMGAYGAAQFLGHGEGDQVIGDARQQQASLTFVPEFGVGLSAGRAVPVAAGPVGEDGVATPRASAPSRKQAFLNSPPRASAWRAGSFPEFSGTRARPYPYTCAPLPSTGA